MSAASMIATHMNVPYGPVVSVQDVESSLRAGRFVCSTEDACCILAAMFNECEKGLIERAAREANVPLDRLQQLYQDSLRFGAHPMPEWA